AAPFIAGVVGWVEFSDADAAATIARLATDPALKGLRPMVQDIADDDWLVRADLDAAFRAVIAHGLVFDALVLPRHLPRLLARLARHPELTVVVDHGAKPPIAEARLDPWRADIAAIARRPNTFCKLSGLVTEAGSAWRVDDLKPYVDHLIGCFGPARLIW